mmetsp:Transcript_43325/g.114238  ORF Transcript_43325/g.114238 Transcript_43325/m.114238 type:complete len:162 (-) Transcript_43325:77-562(-)
MPKLVVPSDVTIAEERFNVGKQKLSWMQTFGLMGMAPTLHLAYNRNDTKDMRAVLTKKYDPMASDPIVEILRTRQESIRKQVVAHNFMWVGVAAGAALPFWSFRKYDWKAKAIPIPFIAYAGSWVGRIVGDIAIGRTGEYSRDQFLGSLPAKQLYVLPDTE